MLLAITRILNNDYEMQGNIKQKGWISLENMDNQLRKKEKRKKKIETIKKNLKNPN